MIDADALVFHLNPLQEVIQPEGQGDFRGLVAKMGSIARELAKAGHNSAGGRAYGHESVARMLGR